MKIILVIPTLKQGGAERVMSELANEFSNKGHEVHLCLLAGCEHFYLLNSDIIVYDLGFVNKGPLRKLTGEIKVFFKLRSLLKSIHPNFVLSFMTKYNAFTILASSFLNIPVFVSDRSNPKIHLPFVVSKLRKATYRFATGIVAQTSLAKELIEHETGHQNIKVIPNPLKEVVLNLEIERKNIILNVGRMVPEKGQKYLLEAFSRIKDSDWELVILGDGPLKNDLVAQAKALNISHKVQMPGSVKNVDEWLAQSSIFAFSSVSEGFPNALVEAMSAELPCVSFDCDAGPRDIIKDNINGYLVSLHDVDTFSEKLEYLIANKNRRITMGKEAAKIRAKLKPSMIADSFLNFCTKKKI